MWDYRQFYSTQSLLDNRWWFGRWTQLAWNRRRTYSYHKYSNWWRRNSWAEVSRSGAPFWVTFRVCRGRKMARWWRCTSRDWIFGAHASVNSFWGKLIHFIQCPIEGKPIMFFYHLSIEKNQATVWYGRWWFRLVGKEYMDQEITLKGWGHVWKKWHRNAEYQYRRESNCIHG